MFSSAHDPGRLERNTTNQKPGVVPVTVAIVITHDFCAPGLSGSTVTGQQLSADSLDTLLKCMHSNFTMEARKFGFDHLEK